MNGVATGGPPGFHQVDMASMMAMYDLNIGGNNLPVGCHQEMIDLTDFGHSGGEVIMVQNAGGGGFSHPLSQQDLSVPVRAWQKSV